jgi:hypothetical protein
MWRDKELPRNLPHDIEQSGIADAPRSNLMLNHLQSGFT